MNFDNSWRSLMRPGAADLYFNHPAPPPFDPDSETFSLANAWWLAEMSRLIYHDRATGRRDSLETVQLREMGFISSGPTQFGVIAPAPCRIEKFRALVFRGTDSLGDWSTNLNAVPVDWPDGGRVHRGFLAALDRVWSEVVALLDASEGPLFIAGHSLGGALATLSAARLRPRAAYTFGSPRVGDAAFGAALAERGVTQRLFRIVKDRDVVASVPPRRPYAYEHAGEFHHLEGSVTTPYIERGWHSPPERMSDHAPINYVASIDAQRGRNPAS
ncbi:MAG: hypothetical protein CMJ18_14910 [Phycisphaeraceae bacterium]|nr:hypothetical protein [Phycisphaeraceae bacterium]